MATYKTPGVYVEEVSTFPPSVAEVATAIPAFFGYTEKGPSAADGPVIKRISTLLDYEHTFGGPQPSAFTISAQAKAIAGVSRSTAADKFLLYYSLDLYFKNGGGPCYIVSVGNYQNTPEKTAFEAGLQALEQEDEPTLIVLTDAVALASTDYYDLGQQALAQCSKLGDRFAILDVVNSGDIATFRTGIGTDSLRYGAAYYPYLKTTLNYRYTPGGVNIQGLNGSASWSLPQGDNGIVVAYSGSAGDEPKVKIISGTDVALEFSIETLILTIQNVEGKTGSDVVAAWDTWKADSTNDPAGFNVTQNGDGSGAVPHTSNSNVDLVAQASSSATLAEIQSTETALYNQIKTTLANERVVLPPSAAVAGIYARVDRARGVWKAPANVSVSSVIGPVTKITHQAQESLNVDPTAGKSINAIREFTGKGILVWGARTLAGNDNEWRYVSVRRLFNLIEESTQKATGFAVFEPNDATTWLKVKAMIESYLYGLWEQGALFGSTPDAAYFVNVGLGKTMTQQDILEGRMIVEIGVAAVRPAEFIILRFSHKMPEA